MTASESGPRGARGAVHAAAESVTVELADGGIAVDLDGPRGAPVLVLIHGSASSGRSWGPMVPLLAGAYRVVRIDLLGHGRSAKPDGAGYAVADQARRAGAVLDRLGIGRAVVAGHSSGGVVATSLAEQRPELVSALVLVNTGPGLGAFISSGAAEIDPSRWPPSDEEIRRFASTGFSRAGYRVPEELLDDVRGMTFGSLAGSMQGTLEYLEERVLPERLAVLGRPLLVVFGADDRRWRSSSAAEYRAVAGAEVVLLPGLGHSPLLEDPERTAAPLLEFAAVHAGGAE